MNATPIIHIHVHSLTQIFYPSILPNPYLQQQQLINVITNFRVKNLKFANKMSDYFGKWTEEKPCECSKENYFTTSLTFEGVQMLCDHDHKLGSYIIDSLRDKYNTHEAVQVKFKCDSCAREFHQTYELKGGNSGKQYRWGYYGKRQNEHRHSTRRFSLEYVEECFAQMSGEYDLIDRSCSYWAHNFYNKVAKQRCACSGAPDNYFTTSLRLVRVKKKWSPSQMHHAVQVTFKCDSCGRQFPRIYELFMEGNGKAAIWHYYTESEIDKVIRTSIRPISFAHLQACFDAMWLKSNFHTANCGDWALEFWANVFEERLNTWEREVTTYENSQKKLARDAKHRELFEKTFIGLKEKREEKERNSRIERSRLSLAQGGKGIATLLPSTSTQIQFNDQNEADLGKKRQQAALVPPLSSNPPRRFFDEREGLGDNSLATQKQPKTSQTVWADTEKAVFTEKIALYPKNFAAIATFLPTKNVNKCVKFYYMTKKQMNYKQTFPQESKKTGRRRYRPPIMPRFGDINENIQSSGKRSMAKLTNGPAAKRQKQQMGTTTPTSTIPSRGKPAAKMTSAIPAAAPPQLERQSQQPQKQQQQTCKICKRCELQLTNIYQYRIHLQQGHVHLFGRTASDMVQGTPEACSRERWTNEDLERHLVMSHGRVTPDLLAKAQRKQDSGRCKLCGMSYGFEILQHLVTEHQVKLSSAEIIYSCDMCAFRCDSYQEMENHLAEKHHSKSMAN